MGPMRFIKQGPHRDLVVPANVELVNQRYGPVTDHAAEQLELAAGAQVHGDNHIVALRRAPTQPGAEILHLRIRDGPSSIGVVTKATRLITARLMDAAPHWAAACERGSRAALFGANARCGSSTIALDGILGCTCSSKRFSGRASGGAVPRTGSALQICHKAQPPKCLAHHLARRRFLLSFAGCSLKSSRRMSFIVTSYLSNASRLFKGVMHTRYRQARHCSHEN